MKVRIEARKEEEDDYGDEYNFIIVEINGNKFLDIGEGEPEDMKFHRSLNDLYSIDSIILAAFNAGKNGEKLDLKWITEEERS